MKFLVKLIVLLILPCNLLLFQSNNRIPSTSLYIDYSETEKIDSDNSIVYCEKFDVTIAEMNSFSFDQKAQEFDSIKYEYAEKGILVKSVLNDSLENYKIISIEFDSVHNFHQIVFGNDDFLAIANFALKVDSESIIIDIYEFISHLSYKFTSPLDEHAIFKIDTSNFRFEYKAYNANVFLFEDKNTEDVLSIIQFPLFMTEEVMTKNLIDKLEEKEMEFTNKQTEFININEFNGLLSVLDLPDDKNVHIDRIYMFVSNTDTHQLVYQLMIKSELDYNFSTIKDVFENISLKN